MSGFSMSLKTARNSTERKKKMSETEFIIKCVLCKAEFVQMDVRSRFCNDCRSKENRRAREVFYEKRKQVRKGFEI
jgi:hypothetical protein